MQKYIKNDLSEIRYFEEDIKVENWIDLKEYRLMTDEEINQHENPYDYLTDEEKRDLYRNNLKPLTRYQFKRCLLENGFKSEDIESKILLIEDEMERELALLGFREATNFIRSDSSIIAVQAVLGIADENIDELWEYALTL